MGAKPYPAYKDSGVEWIGDIPEHWEVKRTKSVVSILKVIAGKLGYEVISVTQRGLRLKDTSSFEGQNAQDYSKYQLVNVDDFVLNHMDLLTGYVGKSTYLGVTSPDYRVVRTVDTRRTDQKFTLFLFQNCYHHKLWYKYGQGAAHLGRWRLPRQEFNEFQLPSPPLEEQKQIASFLDRETSKIDTLIEKQQQLINLLKEKRGSLISHTVTKGLNPNVPMKDSGVEWIGEIPKHWEVKRLGLLCKKIGSGKTPLGGADQYTDSGVMFIRSQNVYDEGLRLEDIVFIDAETDASMAGSRVMSSDILLNITGASIGRSCIVPVGVPKANVNQHVCIIRLLDIRLSNHIEWVLKGNSSQSFFASSQNGAARDGLNFSVISRLNVPFPPLEEQQQIATYLDEETSKIDTLIEKANQSIALLKERRSSLISAAVTGKIDVRGVA